MFAKNELQEKPIGVFDSGFGGLTIVRQLLEKMPNEKIIYFGDSFNAPYGNKSKGEISKLTLAASSFLYEKKIKALIIACNTACVYAYNEIKKVLDIPVFEIVTPSYELALLQTRNNKIGVTATKATIHSQIYRKKIIQNQPLAKVYSFSCPKLVSLIEDGLVDLNEAKREVKGYFQKIKKEDIDVILLACTHYPFLKELIEEVVGDKIKVLDPSVYIAERVDSFLDEMNLKAKAGSKASHIFITSGDSDKFKRVAERLLKIKIDKVEKKS